MGNNFAAAELDSRNCARVRRSERANPKQILSVGENGRNVFVGARSLA